MLRKTRPITSLTRILQRTVTTAVPPKPKMSTEKVQPKQPSWSVSPTATSAAGVDEYLSLLHHPRYADDPALERGQERADAAKLPAIAVSPLFGQYLSITAKSMKAERILEIGTLGGYSTAFLANALPAHGVIDTIELSPEHAKVAQRNFLDLDLHPFPTTHVGPALEVMQRPELREAQYDLIFVDADKVSYKEYLVGSLEMLRSGGLVVLDNTVQGGRVADPAGENVSAKGIRRMYEWIKEDGGRTVLATTIQTVGGKGWDGFTVVLKLAESE